MLAWIVGAFGTLGAFLGGYFLGRSSGIDEGRADERRLQMAYREEAEQERDAALELLDAERRTRQAHLDKSSLAWMDRWMR